MPECSELSQTVADIAMNIGADPKVRNLDDVMVEIKKEFPEFERADVVNAIVEATTRGAQQRTDLSKKLDALKREARSTSEPLQRQRITKQIADLNQRLQLPDPTPTPRPVPHPMTKEIERLAFERDKLRRQVDAKINGMKPRNVFQKTGAAVTEPFNIARSIMTSMDLSAVMRQGGFIATAHPIRALQSFGPMLRAFASEQYAHKAAAEIANRPNAPLYERSKLYLSNQNGALNAHEEGFMSRFAKNLPLVAGSERAYNTFLNKLRADSFDAMAATLARNGNPTAAETKAIANYINVATGRGGLGKFQNASTELATVFFSPRYFTSRIQMLTGQPMYGGSAATRKMVAQEYGRFLIGLGVTYALGAAAGGTIEKDPRSSDFGKIKFGKTRIDPLFSLSQIAVFASRMMSGQTKSSTTGQVSNIRGNVRYGAPDASDVAKSFVRSKLAPLPGTAINLATGKDAVGNPVTLKSTAANLFTPMAVNDIRQAIEEQGVPRGTAIGLLAMFGMGVQTYGAKEKAPRPQ